MSTFKRSVVEKVSLLIPVGRVPSKSNSNIPTFDAAAAASEEEVEEKEEKAEKGDVEQEDGSDGDEKEKADTSSTNANSVVAADEASDHKMDVDDEVEEKEDKDAESSDDEDEDKMDVDGGSGGSNKLLTDLESSDESTVGICSIIRFFRTTSICLLLSDLVPTKRKRAATVSSLASPPPSPAKTKRRKIEATLKDGKTNWSGECQYEVLTNDVYDCYPSRMLTLGWP